MKTIILISTFILLFLFYTNLYSQSGWYVAASFDMYSTGLTGIFFLDSQTGWVCSEEGNKVYKSTDGGTTWNSNPIGYGWFMRANSICFSDANNGRIACGPYTQGSLLPVWHSQDGGFGWTEINYLYWYLADFRSVTYFGGAYWWCGQLNGIEHITYSFIGTDPPNAPPLGHSIPLNRIKAGINDPWTIGNQGLVYRGTTLCGVGDASANLTGVSFHDANTGYVAGGAFMFKTTNNGGSWTRIYPLSPTGTYKDVWFVNRDTGWVACVLPDGNTGAMLGTTNGGISWVQQYSGLAGREICFVNNQTGWAICFNSVIKTTTGGNPGVPNIPSPSSPPNNSIGLPLADTLSWIISPGATSYRLQIATDSNFTSLFLNDSTLAGNTKYVTGLAPLTYYWWRVNAKSSGGTSSFSTPFKFKTMGAPNIPTTLFPPNNTVNQPTSLTFLWSKAYDQTDAPASKYWFELYSDTTIASVIKDTTLTDTLRAVTGLLNNQNYWWRVKAKNTIGWGTFCSYFKFTTIVAPPALAPTLIAPPNNSISIPLTPLLDWTIATGSTAYRVQVSTDSSFATSQFDSTTNRDSIVVPAGKLINNTKYYWHVRGQNIGGNGPYSVKFNFTTNPVSVNQLGNEVPKIFKLYYNYPNPFNPVTKIRFDIPNSNGVNGNFTRLIIYDVLGSEVATLVNEQLVPGAYEVQWDGSNFASGIYYYKITVGDFADVKKMVLIK